MVAGWSKVGTTVAPVSAAVGPRRGQGVVEALPGEVQVDEVAGQRPDAGHLLARGAHGQEHRAAHAQVATAPRHPLGVVAGAGAHHPGRQGLWREPGDEVVGAADLVGADHLEVLALHVHRGAVALREPLAELERGQDPEGGQALRRRRGRRRCRPARATQARHYGAPGRRRSSARGRRPGGARPRASRPRWRRRPTRGRGPRDRC